MKMFRQQIFALFLAFSLVTVSLGQSIAKQIDKALSPAVPAGNSNEAQPVDPLGRSTPRGTVVGFLQAAQSGNYKLAANYLQLSKNLRASQGEQLARDLHVLMDRAFTGKVNMISEKREGSTQAGVPADRERVGVFQVDSNEYDVSLSRVVDPTVGDVWLFSSATLDDVPELAEQVQVRSVEPALPRFLVTHRLLSAPIWIWLAFLLLIPISYGISWCAVQLFRRGKHSWSTWRKHPEPNSAESSLAPPATLILTVFLHQMGVAFLGLPLLYRVYYHQAAGIVLVVAIGWLVFRWINRWGERQRLKAMLGMGLRQGSLILLGQRMFKVLVAIVIGLTTFKILGFDMTTAVAGLGITSIAIAFAAQKSLENLFGGIMVLSDEVIRVGETCRLGDKVGTVEDISLRSTRIRTPDRVELSVPNGVLANMNVENLSRRDKNLFQTKIGLRYETTPDQVRSILQNISRLLAEHPKVDPTVRRVRFIGFGESSLDLEIFCLILTRDWNEFMEIREGLLLKIMDLVTDNGSSLAFPSRTLYLAQDAGIGEEKANAAVATKI
jgi:MscS family membrane protein